jgi:hypothetical protein
VPEYRTIQIPIEQAETGMTVLFPDDESPFRIKVKKLAFSGQEHDMYGQRRRHVQGRERRRGVSVLIGVPRF